MTTIAPFKIAIPDAKLADLKQRLANTILASAAPGAGWEAGPTQEFVSGMVDRLNAFDWRAQEAAINRHPQFTTEIDGQTIHFLHVKSQAANATPLLLLHAGQARSSNFSMPSPRSQRPGSTLSFPRCPASAFRDRPARRAGTTAASPAHCSS